MAQQRTQNRGIFGGRTLPLFNLFGFKVSLDPSWLILGLLIVWSLAAALFPTAYPDLAPATYWWMGVAGALGVFVSIVLHEFSHSLVARRYGLPMHGITLFIFGGVAQMSEEPATPKVEFLMAAAGPLASIVLALVFWAISAYGYDAGWPLSVTGVLIYMAYLNGILAAFNLVPAFPLDGGRMLRAVLWRWRPLRSATRIASNVGSGFGLVLIVLGILAALQGALLTGIWWFLIGLFLRNAASMSYQQVLMRQTLEGEAVRRFMSSPVVTVSPDTPLDRFLEDYLYKYPFQTFPVVQDGRFLGWVNSRDLRSVGSKALASHRVAEVYRQAGPDEAVSAQEDAVRAMGRMNETGNSRLVVHEDGKVIGLLSLRDLMRFLSLKVDLEAGQR